MPAPSKRDRFSMGNLLYLAPVAMTIVRARILVPPLPRVHKACGRSLAGFPWRAASALRISAPGCRPDPPVRFQKFRLEIQDSSRSSNWNPLVLRRVGFYQQDVKALRGAIHG